MFICLFYSRGCCGSKWHSVGVGEVVQKVHFSGQFSQWRDLSGNTTTLGPAGLHQPDWAAFPRPGQAHCPEPRLLHMAHHPNTLIRAPRWRMPAATSLPASPKSSPSNQLSLWLQGPGRAGDYRLSLMGNTCTQGCVETGRWPKWPDTMGLWAQPLLDSGNQPGGSKGRKQLLGHWHIPTIGTE